MEPTTVETNDGPRSISLPLNDSAQRKLDLDFHEKHFSPLDWNSNSKMTCFARCPRKYYYRYGLKLKPIGGGAASHVLDYGTAMHKAIPVLLSGGSLATGVEQFLSFWTPEHDAMDDPKRNKIVAVQALQKFQGDRLNSPYILEKPPQGVQVKVDNPQDRSPWELRFAAMLPGTKVPFTGYLDGIARHRYTKKLYVYEFKTTSQLGATFQNSWNLNPQLLAYAYGTQTLLGEEVVGAVVEGIQSAKTKQDNVQIPVSITQHQIADWVQTTSYLTQSLQSMEQAKFFPKNTAACSPYPMFGTHGYRCEYSPLCETPNWLDRLPMYNIVTDDPYDQSRSAGGEDVSE